MWQYIRSKNSVTKDVPGPSARMPIMFKTFLQIATFPSRMCFSTSRAAWSSKQAHAIPSIILRTQRVPSCTNLSGKEGHARAVDPGVVGSRRHGFEVVLSLGGRDAGTSQLAIVDLDPVSLHRSLHLHQSICINTWQPYISGWNKKNSK